MADTFCVHHRKKDEYCSRCAEEKEAKVAAKAKPPVKVKPEPPAPPTSLTEDERTTLNGLEDVVARGIGTFMEVGTALQQIRDARLYRNEFPTFELYVQKRWEMSRTHADRLISSAEVGSSLAAFTPIGVIPESQAREFVPIKDNPEIMAEVVEAVAAQSGKPTAKKYRDEVRKHVDQKPVRQKPASKPVTKICLDRDDVSDYARLLEAEAVDMARYERIQRLLGVKPA